MKCPICGNEMVPGKIKSRREVMWDEEGKKPQRISGRLEWSWSKAEAERCSECGIVIVKEAQ